jgi:outer membrane protein assembly factor BamA
VATDDGVVDKAKRYVKDKDIMERLSPRDGFYPRIGGLTTGSGLAGGLGYRRHLFGDRLLADLSGVVSLKAYRVIEAQGRWLRFWGERGEVWTTFRYAGYPEEDFFGIGATSSLDTRTSYEIDSTDLVTRGLVHLRSWLTVGADIGYFNPDIDHGADDSIPSTEEVFTDAQAPGLLGPQPNFLHHSLFAEIDLRDMRGNPRHRGYYRGSFSTWDDRTIQQYDFRRFDGSGAYYFPMRVNDAIAIGSTLSYTNNATGSRVPFYALPYVGGADTLRGYREFRFRAENVMSISAEYHWEIVNHVQVAPFIDAGDFGQDWEDIDFLHMKASYGAGLRLHTDNSVFFRFDTGFGGGEGVRFFLKFGPSF